MKIIALPSASSASIRFLTDPPTAQAIRLLEFGPGGDTLRVITRSFEPLAVTGEERQRALDGLKWFTAQGGKVDASKIPHQKPLANSFFVADDGYVWVALPSSGSGFFPTTPLACKALRFTREGGEGRRGAAPPRPGNTRTLHGTVRNEDQLPRAPDGGGGPRLRAAAFGPDAVVHR